MKDTKTSQMCSSIKERKMWRVVVCIWFSLHCFNDKRLKLISCPRPLTIVLNGGMCGQNKPQVFNLTNAMTISIGY